MPSGEEAEAIDFLRARGYVVSGWSVAERELAPGAKYLVLVGTHYHPQVAYVMHWMPIPKAFG